MSDSEKQSVAKRSGIGVAVITAAKGWFMLTGFLQPVLLTRYLGVEGYGVYGALLSAVSILNNVIVAGSIQAMSKSTTAHGRAALRQALSLHALLGAVVSGALVLLSGPIGNGLLRDPQQPALLRIAAIVCGSYSVYAALVGALNGSQRFVAQASLDIIFATLRTGLIVALARQGLGVRGAISGFAIASVIIVLIASVLVARTPKEDSPSQHSSTFGRFAVEYAAFFAPVLLYQLALNLVLLADSLVMQAMLTRREGAGLATVQALVGLYKSAQNFAFLPYQLLLAVTFVVFPVVSKATLEGDGATTRTMLGNALRFSTLALGLMLSVLAGIPQHVLRLAYRAEFANGSDALRILSVGQGFFALTVICATVILATGRSFATAVLMVTMLAAVLLGNFTALSMAPLGVGALAYTATGTAIGCAVGLAATGLYVYRTMGVFIPWKSALRAVGSCAATALLLSQIPVHGKIATLATAAIGALIYVALLVLTREIPLGDLRSIARRGRKA